MCKKRRRVFPVFVIVLFFYLIPLNSFAEHMPLSNASITTPNESILYPLSHFNPETTYIIQDGILYIVTIQRIDRNTRISSGAYKVTYTSPLSWKGSFIVSISSNEIVSAHSASCTAITGSILSSKLKLDNNKQASYHITKQTKSTITNTGFKAQIINNNLVTNPL